MGRETWPRLEEGPVESSIVERINGLLADAAPQTGRPMPCELAARAARLRRPSRPGSVWSRLVAGQLRLLEQHDGSGRRTIVLSPVEGAEPAARALSPVEARIARMLGKASTTKEIAYALKISESAAENHVSRALRKLGIGDRVALVTLYTQLESAGEA